MIRILDEVRDVVHKFFLIVGGIYLFSSIILLSDISVGYRNLISYIHIFSFFPSIILLCANITLIVFTNRKDKLNNDKLPKVNLILGSIIGIVSIIFIIWILMLK